VACPKKKSMRKKKEAGLGSEGIVEDSPRPGRGACGEVRGQSKIIARGEVKADKGKARHLFT